MYREDCASSYDEEEEEEEWSETERELTLRPKKLLQMDGNDRTADRGLFLSSLIVKYETKCNKWTAHQTEGHCYLQIPTPITAQRNT